MKNIAGSHFKPISLAYLLNDDCSSQYYFSGLSKNDYMNDEWSRVTTKSLASRNNDAIWTSDDQSDNICKDIRIKLACGGSAVGCVYPIVIVVSDLSKK